MLVISFLLIILSSCSSNKSEEQDNKIIERERIITDKKVELLRDLNFSRGFKVTKFHSNSSKGEALGYLDYQGDKSSGDPIWILAQWGCTYNMLDATLTKDESTYTYFDNSKLLRIDTSKTGCVSLGIKGSLEYPKTESGDYGDRLTAEQNWPHILISQGFDSEARLMNAKKCIFEISYKINSIERLTTLPLNSTLHAAQFQWFVTLRNDNENTASYKQTMWFGFSMYDSRNNGGTPAGMVGFDGGKEDSTGALIYMFSLDTAKTVTGNIVNLPSGEIGVMKTIKIDVIPFIKMALKAAKNNNVFTDCEVTDIVFGSTNIGFEIPGSYDCSVDIYSMNIYITK